MLRYVQQIIQRALSKIRGSRGLARDATKTPPLFSGLGIQVRLGAWVTRKGCKGNRTNVSWRNLRRWVEPEITACAGHRITRQVNKAVHRKGIIDAMR